MSKFTSRHPTRSHVVSILDQMGLGALLKRVAVPVFGREMRRWEDGHYFWLPDGEEQRRRDARLSEAGPLRTNERLYGHDVERGLTEESIRTAEKSGDVNGSS
jgi:hypothetical protein